MAEAVRLAHRAGKKVMAHAHATGAIRAAVNAGVDFIEHGSFLDDDTAALMVKKGTWLVPTVYVLEEVLETGSSHGLTPASMDKARAVVKLCRLGFETAVRRGVRMVFGADAREKARVVNLPTFRP